MRKQIRKLCPGLNTSQMRFHYSRQQKSWESRKGIDLENVFLYNELIEKTFSLLFLSKKPMSVKSEDIAKETGFSISTVSRVLSNSNYPVSEQIREQVVRAAETMGYEPNIAARSLRTDRTNTIGIIVDDLLSPFTPPIVRGIQDYLNENGFLSLIVNSDWDARQEQAAIKTLLSRPVDAIIFVEYSHQTTSDVLERSNKPHVFVHRLFGSPIKNSVVPDDYYGASLATEHLISLGHRRIGYINGPENWHTCRARLRGYRETLSSHHLSFEPTLVQPGDWENGSRTVIEANCRRAKGGGRNKSQRSIDHP